MTDRVVRPVAPRQREILRQALKDAEYCQDPPVQCRACEVLDGLCAECADGLARARAYLDLGRLLGLEPGRTTWRNRGRCHPRQRRPRIRSSSCSPGSGCFPLPTAVTGGSGT